jgi:galactose mutarotase-like enzyme
MKGGIFEPEKTTSMLHLIENATLKVAIQEQGAELVSIQHKSTGLEYMWSGDPTYWGKKSPVLFPIVGTLKDNTYFFEGKKYHLPRHGFARERKFEVLEKSAESITFSLGYDEETLKVYPFLFELKLVYRVMDASLSLSYQVLNLAAQTLYCSIGAHPAFKLPLTDGLAYEDYYLEFAATENAGIYPINAEGLILSPSVPLLEHTRQLPLNKALFYKDALVFKELASSSMSIRSTKSPHGLTMHFEGFPYFGIWAAKNADFICLEPWCGIADDADSDQDFTRKEGVFAIPGLGKAERTWSLDLF